MFFLAFFALDSDKLSLLSLLPHTALVAPSKQVETREKTGRKCSFALIWVHIQNVTVYVHACV